MLKPLIPSKFVERIITSQTGEQYRVVFQVTLVNGEVKARVVSAELVQKRFQISDSRFENRIDRSTILCLPCATSKISNLRSFTPSFAFIVSPFTSLLFFTSQPTRAPSSK